MSEEQRTPGRWTPGAFLALFVICVIFYIPAFVMYPKLHGWEHVAQIVVSILLGCSLVFGAVFVIFRTYEVEAQREYEEGYKNAVEELERKPVMPFTQVSQQRATDIPVGTVGRPNLVLHINEDGSTEFQEVTPDVDPAS